MIHKARYKVTLFTHIIHFPIRLLNDTQLIKKKQGLAVSNQVDFETDVLYSVKHFKQINQMDSIS